MYMTCNRQKADRVFTPGKTYAPPFSLDIALQSAVNGGAPGTRWCCSCLTGRGEFLTGKRLVTAIKS